MNFGRKIAVYSVSVAAIAGLLILALNPFGKSFTADNFHPFENYHNSDSTFIVDLNGSVHDGIVIPTAHQLPGGKFVFSFRVKNNRLGTRKLAYKIYYQNETYKNSEFEDANGFRYERPEAANNFYGSWEDTGIEFKTIPDLGWFSSEIITDSFRIVGNPRNEEKYFGEENTHGVSAADIAEMIGQIKKDPIWFGDIAIKAKNNKITLNEQLYRDALYSLNERYQHGTTNQRWKRNPRMGSYRFMLVVMDAGAVDGLPVSIRDISKTETDGHNINPFYYFLYGPGKVDKNCAVTIAGEELKLGMKMDPGAGVYVNPFEFKDNTIDTINYCKSCGTDSTLFAKAQFSQFFHSIDKSVVLPTIPYAADVVGDHYTQEQYAEMTKKFDRQRVQNIFNITTRPCETVKSDPLTHTITIFNPGNDSLPYRKEHVGVKSRIGLTYGTYDVCVAFPEIISSDNVWNGIVNAVWLLYQDNAEWNQRSSCTGGYIPKEDKRGQYAERKNNQNYSEIDFEIVKCSPQWPLASYAAVPKPADTIDAAHNRDIVVACTNWDLACMQPEKHVKGVMPLMVDKHRFDLHRWDSWYQAITIRTPENHDDIFKRRYYWYQIEWTPDHIAWRIGPEKDQLTLVGYMDKSVTMIPDNQMEVVVTQEFHDSEWWKPAPFNQRNIPFPKNPIVGKVIAVEVE